MARIIPPRPWSVSLLAASKQQRDVKICDAEGRFLFNIHKKNRRFDGELDAMGMAQLILAAVNSVSIIED
jgi:hypothetical protein